MSQGLRFSAQLKGFREKALDNYDRVRRGVAIRLFKAVIMDTPVLTGRLRANWQTSLNQPNKSVTTSTDTSGGAAITKATMTIKSSRALDVLILTNSLPYVARVEYDGWSHTKAPRGMVRINVERFKRLLGEELSVVSARI